MNTPPMTHSSLRLACQLVIAASSCAAVFAAPLPAEPIREAEQRQVQIGAQAKNLVAALDAMLGEYERNHLGGDDALTVKALRGQLDRLSVEEMRTVVDLLQQARAVQDRGAAAQTVADAYSAQKRISVEMARILAAHTQQGEAAELAKRLNELADRQAQNLRNGIQLARIGQWAGATNLESIRNAQMETQRGEQAAIAQEVQLASGRLRKLAAEPADAEAARNFQQLAAQLKKVEADTQNAAEQLKVGQLQPALGSEISGRDELRRVARAVAPRERGAEGLRKAEAELGKLIAEQTQARESTAKHPVEKVMDKWLADQVNPADPKQTLEQLKQNPELAAKFNQEMAQNSAVLGRVEDQQGDIAIKNDFLAQDLADVPKALDSLKAANRAMQEARTALKAMNAPEAAAKQSAALEKMAAAREDIRIRAEEAEMLAARGGDKTKNLEMLKSAVENLAKEEAAVAKSDTPNRQQQADAARRAEKMAERAAELAPMAAEALKAAVADAKQSEQAMAAADPAKGREEAAQAAQNLAKAAQEIAKEMAKTEAAKQQAADALAALAELAKLIEQEQSIDLDAAKASALSANRSKEELNRLAKMQSAIQEKTEEYKGSLGALQLAATQALGDAMLDMGTARGELEATNAAPAREAAQKAIEKMLAAKNSMGKELAEAMKQMGNEQPLTPEDLAKAANQIQEALKDVNAAQQSLAQAAQQSPQAAQQAMAKAAEQLAKAAQQAGQAAAEALANSPELQQAAQQAATGAAQAMAGQNAPAQQAAQQAAQQLAQAAAAMAAQQAGIGQQQAGASQQPGQGQEPGPGMKGQGQQPGRGSGTGKKQTSTDKPPGEGAEDYKAGGDPQAVERQARQAALKKANFIALPAREREAIQQSLGEKYPAEYGPMVEQYLLNLANEAAKK